MGAARKLRPPAMPAEMLQAQPCTTCGRLPGETCIDGNGNPTPGVFHGARYDRLVAAGDTGPVGTD